MRDFIAKNVFFRLFIALAAGIASFGWFGWSVIVFFAIVVVAVGLSLFYLFTKNRLQSDVVFGVAVMLLIFSFGYLLGYDFYSNIPKNIADGKAGFFEVELSRYPIEKQKSVLVYANLLQYSDSTAASCIDGKVVLYLQKDSRAKSLRSGDRLLIYTSIALPSPKGNPDEFDYREHLLRKGICGTGYVDSSSWKLIDSNKSFSITRLAQHSRMRLLDILKSMNITGDEFAVISALTLGYTDAISPELSESFSATGASHVLSVSGLHVGIIYVMLGFLLAFLDKKEYTKRIKWILIIIALWFYAFITGLSPSVCRAVFMFSVFALSKVFDRPSSIYNNIFLSAFVLLIINPMWLFNVGFQLSYSALLSIIYFQPKIEKWFTFDNRPLRYVWTITSLSIAAQIGAAPLCIYYFHRFPNYFLLSNFVGVPFAGIIIYIDVALFAFYKIPFINDIVSFLLIWCTRAMNFLLNTIEHFPFATLQSWISPLQLISIYVSIISLGFLSYKVKFKYITVLLVSCIAFFGIEIFNKVSNIDSNELVVFNDNKCDAINILNNGDNKLITNDIQASKRLTDNFWLHGDRPTPTYIGLDTMLGINTFEFDGKSFVVVSSDSIYRYKANYKLVVDYLIITGGVYASHNLLRYYFHPNNIILAASVSRKNQRLFRRIAEERNISCYSVAHRGAFRLPAKRNR